MAMNADVIGEEEISVGVRSGERSTGQRCVIAEHPPTHRLERGGVKKLQTDSTERFENAFILKRERKKRKNVCDSSRRQQNVALIDGKIGKQNAERNFISAVKKTKSNEAGYELSPAKNRAVSKKSSCFGRV